MGKGSRYRPVDRAKYDEGYERIFGVKPQKEIKNEENGKGVPAHEEEVQDKVVEGSPQQPAAAD